jgi:predicted  nucleic acid-binding Zn-ribbon protein
MLDVLCFSCGVMFKVAYGTDNITKQCPKCQDKMFEQQVSFEE